MRPHKKKLLYVPDNDVNIYDYGSDSDGADEEIGVISRGSRAKKYHYNDSRNSLPTRINQFILFCLSMLILYSTINPDNGILGIVFKGSICDHVINGAISIKDFVYDISKPKVKNRKTAIKTTTEVPAKEKETVDVKSENDTGSENEFSDESEEEDVPADIEIPVINAGPKPK